MYICKHCGEFRTNDRQALAGHASWCKERLGKDGYEEKCEGVAKRAQKEAKKMIESHYRPPHNETQNLCEFECCICKKPVRKVCSKTMARIKAGKPVTCGRACANKMRGNRSEETKLKIANSVRIAGGNTSGENKQRMSRAKYTPEERAKRIADKKKLTYENQILHNFTKCGYKVAEEELKKRRLDGRVQKYTYRTRVKRVM